MKDLLLEIGTEEIPASFLAPASETLKETFAKFLLENRMSFRDIKTFYTPRRIALLVSNVSEKQKAEIVEVQGPPKKFAYDDKGNPTKVAVGFASSNKVKVKELYTRPTAKGEYVFLKKQAEIKTLMQLLKLHLPLIICNLPFPKTMRWNHSKMRFARPIRWISLIYGTKPILVNIDGLKSSNYSLGHRNAVKPRIKITNAKQYVKTLRKHHVMVNPNERQKYIKKQINVLARNVRGKVILDQELLQEATNICELPCPILAEFKPEFLSLPSIVLITALKTHTRSFAVKSQISKDNLDRILPYFIAIANTPSCDKKKVAYWYEEAVEARLSDAKFYFDEDVKIGLEQRVEQEKQVVWIEGLGTLFDKTRRIEKLVFVLSQRIPNADKSSLLRAALLCKADLLTNMVREKEYTALEGIMGGIYASAMGEDELVAKIISEHYLPKSVDDDLPKTIEGSILSIADKLDNIVGAFIVNAIPSGSADPFALRRQAIAIIGICLQKKFFVDLNEIIELNLEYFDLVKSPNKTEIEQNQTQNLLKAIKGFFTERLNSLLLDRNIKYDIANAVLATDNLNVIDVYERARALTEFRKEPEFELLVIGQKRVANILKGITESFVVDENLLKETAEHTLYQQAKSLESSLQTAVHVRDYKKALQLLLSLRPAIDSLFDNVLVMTDEIALKNNRLGLLQYVKSLFLQIADLSEIVIQ